MADTEEKKPQETNTEGQVNSNASSEPKPAAPQIPEPLFANAQDYVITLKVLRALKKYEADGNAKREPQQLAEYLAANDVNVAGLSVGQILTGFENIKKMDGKGNALPKAKDSLTELKIKREYERFKQAQRDKMEVLQEGIESAKKDTTAARKEYEKSGRKLFGARFGRFGLIAAVVAIGGGYVGGALSLAGGLAALSSVSSMGLLTVAAIGGVLLYRVGKWAVTKAWKALGNIIDRHKARRKGIEKGNEKGFGSKREYDRCRELQNNLENQYGSHRQKLRAAELSTSDELFNQIVDTESVMAAQQAAQRDAVGLGNVAQNNATRAAEPAVSTVVHPARDTQPVVVAAANTAEPVQYTYDPHTAGSGAARPHNSGSNVHSTNTAGAAPVGPTITNTSVPGGTSGTSEPAEENPVRKSGIEYTYPVARPTLQQYNVGKREVVHENVDGKDRPRFANKGYSDADVATFVRMALRLELADAKQDVVETNGKTAMVNVDMKNGPIVSRLNTDLTQQQTLEAAKQIVTQYAGVTDKHRQENYLLSNSFMSAVGHQMNAIRKSVKIVHQAQRDQKISKGAAYNEQQFVQDVLDGKVSLNGQDLKQSIVEYITDTNDRNNIRLQLAGTDAPRTYNRKEFLTMTAEDKQGDVDKPIDPRAMEKFARCAGFASVNLDMGNVNALSSNPEYTEYIGEEDMAAIREAFSDVPNMETQEDLIQAMHDNEIRTALEAKLKSGQVLSGGELTVLGILRRQSEQNAGKKSTNGANTVVAGDNASKQNSASEHVSGENVLEQPKPRQNEDPTNPTAGETKVNPQPKVNTTVEQSVQKNNVMPETHTTEVEPNKAPQQTDEIDDLGPEVYTVKPDDMANVAKALSEIGSDKEFADSLSLVNFNGVGKSQFDTSALATKMIATLANVDESYVPELLSHLTEEQRNKVTNDAIAVYSIIGKFASSVVSYSEEALASGNELKAIVPELEPLHENRHMDISQLDDTIGRKFADNILQDEDLGLFISGACPMLVQYAAKDIVLGDVVENFGVNSLSGEELLRKFADNPAEAIKKIATIAKENYLAKQAQNETGNAPEQPTITEVELERKDAQPDKNQVTGLEVEPQPEQKTTEQASEIKVTDEDVDIFLKAIQSADKGWEVFDKNNRQQDEYVYKAIQPLLEGHDELQGIKFRTTVLEKVKKDGGLKLGQEFKATQATINSFMKLVHQAQFNSNSPKLRADIKKFLSSNKNTFAMPKLLENGELAADSKAFMELFAKQAGQGLDIERLQNFVQQLNLVQQEKAQVQASERS